MNQDLTSRILRRLADSGDDDSPFALIILAALEGDDTLDGYLANGESAAPAVQAEPAADTTEPPGIYLKSISVEGFRGIAGAATLSLTPGPGLTLVVGRNGSGKSSFAEGLELLLTGRHQRWDGRPKAWADGWRNVHHAGPTRVSADLIVEGDGATVVDRSWPAGDALESGAAQARRHGQKARPLSELGWSSALDTFRPFLSYNELGSMLEEGPSKLYDALSPILGLDDMLAVQQRITTSRKARQDQIDTAKAGASRILALADEMPDDARARGVAEGLKKREWDLEGLQALAAAGPIEGGEDLSTLRSLSLLEGPSLTDVETAASALRTARANAERVATTDAARSRARASLLEAALGFAAGADQENCPVCGTPSALTRDWRTACAAEIANLQEEARELDAAHKALGEAIAQARRLCQPPPSALAADGLPLQALDAACNAWRRWNELASTDDEEQLARELEERAVACTDISERLRVEAAAALSQREDRWRPLGAALVEWLPSACTARANTTQLPDLKKAEKWWKAALEAERDDRFKPVADKALATWRQLRLQSNVDLEAVELEGNAQRRRVDLKVTVDGTPASAVGVMSQGELHALALSLFLPRAALPESPFRFICIDDPVQSMDPSRVEGLARALADAARTRQVIVFTHDDRLPESTRRLGIPAQVVQVTRREASQVEVRVALDPVAAALQDARALVKTRELPPRVAARVVPGFCRVALEASGMAVVRRRCLNRGDSHQAVEDLLADQTKLYPLFALALFDDPERTSDVLARLSKLSVGAAETFKACNAGAHEEVPGSMEDLVRATAQLTERLAQLN